MLVGVWPPWAAPPPPPQPGQLCFSKWLSAAIERAITARWWTHNHQVAEQRKRRKWQKRRENDNTNNLLRW